MYTYIYVYTYTSTPLTSWKGVCTSLKVVAARPNRPEVQAAVPSDKEENGVAVQVPSFLSHEDSRAQTKGTGIKGLGFGVLRGVRRPLNPKP